MVQFGAIEQADCLLFEGVWLLSPVVNHHVKEYAFSLFPSISIRSTVNCMYVFFCDGKR